MGVSADYYINAPRRIEHFGQLLVLLKADVSQQNGEVDVDRIICVADSADLGCGLVDSDKGADESLVLCLRDDLLCQDADEKNFHSVNLKNDVRSEQARLIGTDKKISVDDREFCAFLKKEKMRNSVIRFMIAESYHIGSKGIHYLNRAQPLVFGINNRASEHIACDAVECIRLFLSHLVNVAGKHTDSAYKPIVNILGKKISVHIVRVQKHQFFIAAH